MPYTPYHFGLNGFLGLLFRRRLDVPMMLLANILLDMEVLAAGWFSFPGRVHQFLHLHTLLLGGIAGAAMGAVIYSVKPLRRLCEWAMAIIGLPYHARFWPMVFGGLLGDWLHVLIDTFYHSDVLIFWPYAKNPLHRWMFNLFVVSKRTLNQSVLMACLIFWGLLITFYLFLLFKKAVKAWKMQP